MFVMPLPSVLLLFSLCLWLLLLSLKDRHDVLSKKNKGKYAFSVRSQVCLVAG